MICSVLPRVGVGHTYPLMLSSAPLLSCLYANLASFALDYVARQKMAGTHLTYGYVTQLPVLAPSAYQEPPPWEPECSLMYSIRPRVLELGYTAHDLAAFAADLGDSGLAVPVG